MSNCTRTLGALLVVLALGGLACSPEATRARGGGPGADPGNRSKDGTVQMHGGQRTGQVYYQTPSVGRGVEVQR